MRAPKRAPAGDESGRRLSARRDVVVIVLVAILAGFVCVKFNVSEALLKWTRPFERLQLDELPAFLLVVAVSLIWFSSRRYFDAIRQLRLRKIVEAQLAETLAENKRLAQQYLDTQEHERKVLARDLHDELGQYLNAIKLDAMSIRESTSANTGMDGVVGTMIASIDRLYGVVRGLIRQLRPVGLDELGVGAALEHCVNEWRMRLPQAALELSIVGDLEHLDEVRGLVVYRLVQEALTNVARHSGAKKVQIRIASGRDEGLYLRITDDGAGMDMGAPRAGLGLVGMRERVQALGGSIRIASSLGGGFEIEAAIPRHPGP
jgi:two-component system, NarL family, sensor histidine kinase UhpB